MNFVGIVKEQKIYKVNTNLLPWHTFTGILKEKQMIFCAIHVFVYVIRTNLMHYLSSIYFVNQPLHVSGVFVAHHQEVYCIYTTIGTYCRYSIQSGREVTVHQPIRYHNLF